MTNMNIDRYDKEQDIDLGQGLAIKVVKDKKYFFLNRFEKLHNDFSNFETPSLAVLKFRNA